MEYINIFSDKIGVILSNTHSIKYNSFLIFQSYKNEFHIVKDGKCVGMYAGMNGAKRAIDKYTHKFRVRSLMVLKYARKKKYNVKLLRNTN